MTRDEAVAQVHAIAGTLTNRGQARALEAAVRVLHAPVELPDDPRERAEAAAADAERLQDATIVLRPELAWQRAVTYALLASLPQVTVGPEPVELDDLHPDERGEQVEPTLAAPEPPRRARATGPGRAVKDAPQA